VKWMENKLIGDYIASGHCGSAFDVVGHPDKVIKIVRLMDYKSPIDEEIGLEIGDYQKSRAYKEWKGGIALNEFQAVLFNMINEKNINGDEDDISPHLPKLYGFITGEMEQYLIDELINSYDKYKWSASKMSEMLRNFKIRKGDIPGTRIGLWIMERVEKADGDSKDFGDTIAAKNQIAHLNKWFLEHNFIVRDTRNEGNWGFRGDTVVWFDPGVAPFPISSDWAYEGYDDHMEPSQREIKLSNVYSGFAESFGKGELSVYRDAIADESFEDRWWQAEDEQNIIQFLAESEIVGDYMKSGVGGSVFAINNNKVLKIVRLDKTFYDQPLNDDQSEFMEEVYLDKLKGIESPSEMVKIEHYNKGTATEEMVEIINAKVGTNRSNKIKKGEPIALWIMEYVPTIGNGTLTIEEQEQGESNLEEWGEDKGWLFSDLHDENYGQRADGSYVAFDMWPKKQYYSGTHNY